MRKQRRSDCQGPEEGQDSLFKELRLGHRQRGEGNLRTAAGFLPLRGKALGWGLRDARRAITALLL